MAVEKITIAELDIDVNALLKSTAEVKATIDSLKKAQKELEKQGDTNSEQWVQNAADLKVLNSAYASNLKAIADSTNAQAEAANRTQLIALALQSEVTSIREAREQNSLLNKLRNDTNVTTAEGKAELDALNKKLDENNAFIKENADAYLQQKINIGNYSESIKEALGELNLFNGGFSGFIERSQEAGGVGNLVTNSLKGITQGIIGMTRASLAFLATPIGAVIGAIGLALGLLVNYLKSTQGGIDAVNSVLRPLQAVLTAVGSVVAKVGEALFNAFTSPKKAITDLFNFVSKNIMPVFKGFSNILIGIATLDFSKIKEGAKQTADGVGNIADNVKKSAQDTAKFFDEAIKKGQEIDRLKKQIERSELDYQRAQIKTNDQLDELELIVKNTSLSFKERAKAAEEQIRLTEELSQKEQAIVEAKIKALKLEQSLKDAKQLTIEEQQKLVDLEKELDEAQDRGLNARIEKSRVLAGLAKEQREEAEKAAKEAEAARQKALDDALAKTKAELDLFLSSQGVKVKSIEDQLKIAERVYQQELKIAKQTFDASEKTEADKLALQTQQNEARNKLLQSQTDIVIANAERELEIFKQNNQSKLDAQKFLNDESVKLEQDRLNAIAQEQRDFAQLQLEQGVIDQTAYNLAINQVNAENQAALDALAEQKKQADKEKAAIDLENERAAGEQRFLDEFAIRERQIEEQRAQEIAAAEKNGADVEKINKKFNAQLVALDKQKEIAKIDNTRNALNTIQGLASQFFGDSKALNSAIALADTLLSVQKAYLSQFLPVPTPDSPARGTAAGLKALGFGLANVAKIQGIKFEKGGTQLVGGNRHAQGGTKFVGSDGTAFEAEKGELIGVLNRNASAQFMAFNNAFGKRGQVGTSYLANGGIVARGMDSGVNDLEQLAVLTANAITQMPAPIVTVEDINSTANRVNVIENGANF